MTKLVNAVLERVLSEELGRQNAWLKDDMNNGFDTSTREAVITELKEFMTENDIEIRPDFIDGAYTAEMGEDYEDDYEITAADLHDYMYGI